MSEITTDVEWLREMFEYESCVECGQGAEHHVVCYDPLGHRSSWCSARTCP